MESMDTPQLVTRNRRLRIAEFMYGACKVFLRTKIPELFPAV